MNVCITIPHTLPVTEVTSAEARLPLGMGREIIDWLKLVEFCVCVCVCVCDLVLYA